MGIGRGIGELLEILLMLIIAMAAWVPATMVDVAMLLYFMLSQRGGGGGVGRRRGMAIGNAD
jgi:hypothetical protein